MHGSLKFQNDRHGLGRAAERTRVLVNYLQAGLDNSAASREEIGDFGGPYDISVGASKFARLKIALANRLFWRQHLFNDRMTRRLLEVSSASVSNKPWLLYLVPYDAVQPIVGGAVRVHELSRILSHAFRISILTVTGPRQEAHVLPLGPDLDLLSFPVSAEIWDEMERNRARFGPASWSITLMERAAAVPNLISYLRSVRDEIGGVIVTGPFLYPCVEEAIKGVPVFYETLDVATDFLRVIAGPVDLSPAEGKIAEVEKRLLGDASLVVCVTGHDRDELIRRYSADPEKFRLVPNGVNVGCRLFSPPGLSREHRRDSGLDRPVVLFVGSAMEANLKAAEFIATMLAPGLPHALFVIMGIAGDQFRHATGHAHPDNVVFTGRVVDSSTLKEALFLLAEVAIAPMASGSGSSLKISDYLAHGKAVIATEIGARGFDAFHPLLTLASLEQFGPALSRVLKEIEFDSASVDQRCRKARAQIEATMDWKVVAEPLVRDLRARIRT